MGSYSHFENSARRLERNHRNADPDERTNYDAYDNPTVSAKSNEQKSFFEQHIKQYTEFISWAR